MKASGFEDTFQFKASNVGDIKRDQRSKETRYRIQVKHNVIVNKMPLENIKKF